MKTQIVNKLYGGDASFNQYQSKSYLRNSLSKTWILNNVTGTNGIASWGDLSTTYFNKSGKNSSQCPTKSEIMGALKSTYGLSISGYQNNQLVKYSAISPYSLKFSFYAYIEKFGATSDWGFDLGTYDNKSMWSFDDHANPYLSVGFTFNYRSYATQYFSIIMPNNENWVLDGQTYSSGSSVEFNDYGYHAGSLNFNNAGTAYIECS